VDKALEGRGFDEADTLFGSSICPDEINHEAGDIPDLLCKRFGPEFNLGGLAGIPFTGKTGFGAFAAHVPTNGHIFIVYAPHVGISDCGAVGYYHREGQTEMSTACGACLGALSAVEGLEEGHNIADEDMDYQMSFIKRTVKARLSAIKQHGKGKIVGLVHEIYKKGMEMMMEMMDLKMLHGGSLALLGGLQINMPDPMEDFFLPLDFKVLKEDSPPEDLIHILDEGRIFDIKVQPHHVGGRLHSASPQLSPALGPDIDGGAVPLLDGKGSAASTADKDKEIAELKEKLIKMSYAYEAREQLLEHMTNLLCKK